MGPPDEANCILNSGGAGGKEAGQGRRQQAVAEPVICTLVPRLDESALKNQVVILKSEQR